jgi:coenzyme F420-reducing hydrogenase alpha subunit
MLYAFDEALRILGNYEEPERPFVPVEPPTGIGAEAGAAVGHAITEAPRGILYHRYRIDDEGLIREARIVPPTAQNQPTIEDDLREFVTANLDLPDDRLTWRCEQAIRNYDPCISCATHFLKLEIDRR